MAERTNAAVLKTVVPRGTVGSNPTSSARKLQACAEMRTLFCFCTFTLVGFEPMRCKQPSGLFRAEGDSLRS